MPFMYNAFTDYKEFKESVKPETVTNVPPPLTYSEFPKWLNPPGKSQSPVIVYSPDQEQEYLSRGYGPPGIADPNAFLVAKVTEKLDDNIRRQDKNLEDKTRAALERLTSNLREMIREEIKAALKDFVPRPEEVSGQKVTVNLVGPPAETETSSKIVVDFLAIAREMIEGGRRNE